MPDSETNEKTARMHLATTQEERDACEFIYKAAPKGKYDGASSVVRDYSLQDAVSFYRRAMALAASDDRRTGDDRREPVEAA